MYPVKVFRQGKGSFFEWHYEDGKPLGRIRNQGEGVFLEEEFSSVEDARLFCQKVLDKDPAPFFYVMQEDDIIDSVYDREYHDAKDKKENRILVTITLAIVLLLATGVSVMVMPFQAVIYHVLFIAGVGGFYLLVNSTSVNWNLESVGAVIILLVLLAALVPHFSK